MFDGLITIAGGILAASALIIARKPNAKALIDKLTPYQGWLGIVLFFWGIWGVLGAVRFMSLLSDRPILWIFWIVSSVVDLLIGFLLGFGLITKYTLRGNQAAQIRGQEVRAKLAAYQGPIGLLGICMGSLYIVLTFVL